MLILIESPKTLLPISKKQTRTTHGANNISKVLLSLFINDISITKIIVSDLNNNELNNINKPYFLEKKTIITNYFNLKKDIESFESIPDICLNFDSNILKLLYFRNVNKFSYPIIGLIHSLGFFSHFKIIKKATKLFERNDLFICSSKNTQETLLNFGFNKNQAPIISYGVNISKFKPIENKSELRKRLSLDQNSLIILILGRISPSLKMDIAPVLRALPDLIKKYPSIKLYIVGKVLDQNYVFQLKKLITVLKIEKNIIWETNPNNDNIEIYYQASDIFLSLSDYCGETFGLTILEAMSCALPVVISKFSGYKDHLKNENNGFYCKTYTSNIMIDSEFYTNDNSNFGEIYSQSISINKKELLFRLNNLLQSKELRLKTGSNARNTIINSKSNKIMYQNYKYILEDMLKNKENTTNFKTSPEIPNISNIFSHQCSNHINYSDTLYLSKETINKLETESELFFFESQLETYTLITQILSLLYKNPLSIKEISTKINKPRIDVAKNCLFLIKQTFIVTYETKLL